MPFASEDEKMMAFDALGEEGQAAELSKFKDPLKKVAFSAAYKSWKSKQPGAGKALGLGIETGATLSFRDEIAGAAGALGYKLAEPKSQNRPWGDVYREAQQESLNEGKKASQAHGGAYLAGELGGGALLGSLGGVPTSAYDLMTQAGVMGAVAGAGASEADLLKGGKEAAKQVARDAAQTGAVSEVLAPVAGAIGKGLSTAGEAAALQAFKAAHPALSDFKEIPKAQAIKIGRRLLNENIVNFGSSAENVATNAAGPRKASGEALNKIYAELDAARPREGLPADEILINAIENIKGKKPSALAHDITDPVMNEIDKLAEKYKGEELTFQKLAGEKAEGWRRGYQTQDFKPTSTATGMRMLAHDLGEQLKAQAAKIDPNLHKDLIDELARYAEIAPADEIATAAAAKAMNAKGLSFSDAASMLGGSALGGQPGAVVGGIISHTLKNRGNSMAAVVLNNLAKWSGNKDISGVVAKTMLNNPARLERFLPELVKAAGRSDEAFKTVAEQVAGLPEF